jgi:methyl-accepting chemotaxis protein
MSAGKSLSIKLVLGALIGIMGFLLFAFSASTLYQAFQRERRAQSVALLTVAGQHLFNIQQFMRLERGNAMIALQADASATPAAVTNVTGNRTRAEDGYARAVEALAAIEQPEFQQAITRLRSTRDAVHALRGRIDEAMQQAKNARNAELVSQWPGISGAYVDAAMALGAALENAMVLNDPMVDWLLAIKRAAWVARTYAGQQALRMLTALSANRPWNQAQILETADDGGRMHAAWAIVMDNVANPAVPARLRELAGTAQSVVSGPIAQERQRMIDELSQGRVPQVVVTDVSARQIVGLNQIAGLANMAMEETVARAAAERGRALIDMAIWGALALVAIALAVAGQMIANSRVSSPIRSMTDAMRRLAERDTSVAVPGVGRGDEIGAMASAVQVFKDNLIEAERLAEEKAARERAEAEHNRTMAELQREIARAVGAGMRGDFSQRVVAKFADPELQSVGEGLNQLLGTVQESLGDLMIVLEALGAGDLTRRVDRSYEGAFAALADGTNGTAEKLADVISRIGEAVGTLDSAASEILSGANDLAQRTSTQAAMVEETAAAVEEFSTTVQTNASRASRASELARSAELRAQEGGSVMKEAQDAMGRIDDASTRISEVVGLIENIAFQTNLLALNASVEAARAGEAGRGFAVVASEVRRLAQHASEASTEVKSLISTSVGEVRSGVDLVTKAGGSLAAIVSAINEVTGLMVEIAGVSKEQAITINEIGQAVRKLDEMTQQNAALVEETNSAIHMTEQQVTALNGTVGEFRVSGQSGGRKRRHAA